MTVPSAPRVHVARPGPADATDFVAAVQRSRALHGDWVTAASDGPGYHRWLERLTSPETCAFLIRELEGRALAGAVVVSQIVRAGFQSAYLGYYAFEPLAGRGLMTEGLRVVLAECFGPLELHRVEANIQPSNQRSLALVQRLGFRREGFSPRYLYIAGSWRDHERWALTAEDWRNATPASAATLSTEL